MIGLTPAPSLLRRYLAIAYASIDIAAAASDVFPNFSLLQLKLSRCAKDGNGSAGARDGRPLGIARSLAR